jgi:spore germination protein KC
MTVKKIFLPLIILLLTFSGCWDRREVESLALVQALGLDPGPGGKGVTITTMIAIPAKLKGGGGGESGGGGSETGVFVLSTDAPTIYEGFNLINTTVNREVTLLQNTTLIISDDLARKGIRKWIDSLIRYREMRRTVAIFICQGKAADIMKVKPKLERNPAEYFLDLARLNRLSGMFPMMTLNEFMDRYEAKAQEDYTPLLGRFHRKDPDEYEKQSGPGGKKPGGKPSVGGTSEKPKAGGAGGGGGKNQAEKPKTETGPPPEAKDARMIGTAIFKKDKMVGHLDIYETQALQMLTGQFREALLTVSDPLKKGFVVAFRLMAATPPKIKYVHKNNTDYFSVNIKMEADLISIQSGINYTMPSKEALLSKYIAVKLKRRINEVVKKAQKQYNSDVFGLGVKVRNTMLTGPDWERYDWPNKFKDAKIKTNVKVAVRRIGVQFQPPLPR